MANTTLTSGQCVPPFLDVTHYPTTGGFIEGRLCAPVPQLGPNLVCCLPCPATDWIYPPSFKSSYRVAESINAVSLVICVFLLASFVFLPVEKTRRHYLSICLIIGIMFLALGFVIPLGVQPSQCYNDITPNDMYSNMTCAWSGAFILVGGLSIDVWIFVRALSMHLQICWDIMPGQRFFYAAQALGWGVIAVLFTITITITGVSFRFGDACHINSAHALKDFWGPLLAIAGASALVQILTFLYCIKVYLRSMWSDDKTETNSSAGLPSYTNSVRVHSAKAIYRRVRKVLWLQWRGMLIVVFILTDVVFFAVSYVYLDKVEERYIKSGGTNNSVMPFLYCLFLNGGEPDKCFHLGQKATMTEATAIAILILLSLAGVQCFLLLARWTMFTGWVEHFRNKFHPQREFVSLDARHSSANVRSYELLKIGSPSALKTPSTTLVSPAETYASPFGRSTPEYFHKEIQREYRSPSLSFSSPQTPSQVATREWDPRSGHAREGLGLHPPRVDEEEEDDDMFKL